ncbi:MAG TPA: carboxylesterase family protein [Rhizomicrobium sp.]|nr:carboxylesterase family protein [Rhizomicrobium sp.]
MPDFTLSRRSLAGLSLGLASTGLSSPALTENARCTASPAVSTASEILRTPQGALIGEVVERKGDRIASYKGIPYAQPPIGGRRWRAAEAAPAWNCTRDATTFGPQAVQLAEPDAMFYALPQAMQSEDCLYLNVWTPAMPGQSQASLPVMVWIHGGAFVTGAGSIPVYDGAALARKGVVVVTINYRLGVLGYFAHPELVAEASGGICANFGTTDQIEALRWVARNIEAFGGDPGNVTIFGQSAGAMSVCQLLASPPSKGLFHRAIGQSGGFFFPMRALGRASWGGPPAEELGRRFAERIGAPSLEALRAMPAQSLVAAAPAHGDLLNQNGALMCVDGIVFERPVHETFRLGHQHAVPVLVGFASDEGSGIADYGAVPAISDSVKYESEIRRRYGAFAGRYLALYPSGDAQSAVFDAFRDEAFGWHVMEWAARTAQVRRDAFLYYFTHTPPGAEALRPVFGSKIAHRIGAYHAADIAYVFDNADRPLMSVWGDGKAHANRPSATPRESDIRLADIMSDYWVAFARTGTPHAPGLPPWGPFTQAGGRYMRFGDAAAEPSRHLLPGMWELHTDINAARARAELFWYFANLGIAGPELTR